MIDKYTEARLENWARANRENLHQASKCPTQVFCESLRYLYGMPEEEEGQACKTPQDVKVVDLKDAEKLNQAYRSELLPNVYKSLLRMYYVNRVNPRSIERRLCLAHKTIAVQIEFVHTGNIGSKCLQFDVQPLVFENKPLLARKELQLAVAGTPPRGLTRAF